MINPTHCIPEIIAESSPKLRIKKKKPLTQSYGLLEPMVNLTQDGKFYMYNLTCTIFCIEFSKIV
jgi:hypothetical protein